MIAVTGAAGFIGSVLVWRLNQLGEDDILCVDKHPDSGASMNLAPLHFREYVDHERFLAGISQGQWKELDCVFHLGACSSTTETDVAYLTRNNVDYTRLLCEAALARDVRFIHASSASVYGNGEHGYVDDHALTPRLVPLNAYGRSKHEFEKWALTNGLLDRIVLLRYFNVYGPNEWHKGPMRSMVCKGYEQIRDTGRVQLFKSDRPEYSDGGQKRDFVWVKDAVDVTLWFRQHRDANGIFNVGSGEATTWNRLIGAIFKAMGREPSIDYIEMPSELASHYQYFTRAEMGKLRDAGYTVPMTPIEDAVADYVQNHLIPGRRLGASSMPGGG